MKRSLSLLWRPEAYSYLKYVLPSMRKVKNWPQLLMNYAGLRNSADTYLLRNGLRIKTGDTVDTATVLLICVKEDYGKPPDNAVIIDIGANIGVYSIFAAFGKNNRVYAYEPMRAACDLMEENVRLNELEEQVKIFNQGVGARREHRTLHLGRSSVFSSMYDEGGFKENTKGEAQSFECIRLQDVFDENGIEECDILKMDCEGAEYEALYNLPDEYFKRIKELRMEFHTVDSKESYNYEHLIEFMKGKGFVVTLLEKHPKKKFGTLWFERKN